MTTVMRSAPQPDGGTYRVEAITLDARPLFRVQVTYGRGTVNVGTGHATNVAEVERLIGPAAFASLS